MKNLCITLVILSIAFLANAQTSSLPKLSPRTQQYLLGLKKSEAKSLVNPEYVYRKTPAGLFMSALIKVSPSFPANGLDNLGVHVGTRAGRVWTVIIPVNNVTAFTKTAGIEYIELDEPGCMKLDSVRRVTHVDSVHEGINLPMGYTGKGVIVGVVDAGFDYTHPMFYDTLGHSYRIKRVWEEKKMGTPPVAFAYGNEITDTTAMKAEETDNTTFSHATHVTGMAGGSGYGSSTTNNSKYRGMAYESDLVMVGIMPDSSQWQSTGMSDFLDGINYVFTYAESVHEPAVVNLSWGTPAGPHDGQSLFSQACDALTGPGKIFVCSAGNNGGDSIHIQKTFTNTDSTVSTFVSFDPNLSTQNTWLDTWGDSGMTFCVNVALYHDSVVSSTGFVCLDDTIHEFNLTGTDGNICNVTITTYKAEFNGKPRIYLSLSSLTTDSVCLTLNGHSGTLNLWNSYVRNGEGYYGQLRTNGRSWATPGNSDYTTSDIVATNSCISAGAFTTKVSFSSLAGGIYGFGTYATWGHLAPFSSHGPTADGRIKPDIASPGLTVVSSLNSFDTSYALHGTNYTSCVSTSHFALNGRTYYYGQMAGTSMASPATTGIVALFLQANPLLTPTDIKNIFAQTAIQDTFTGALPITGTNLWGHGKINAWAGTWAAFNYPVSGISQLNAPKLNCDLFPNPNKGTFTLSYTAEKSESLSVELYDLNGQLLYADIWKVIAGSNTKQCSTTGLSKGIYITRVASATGASVIKNMIF